MKTKSKPALPRIVSAGAWWKTHEKILAKEKALTRQHDRLAAERRRQPMTQVTTDYVFTGLEGKVRLLDLFEGRRQLIIYHFMFAPDVHGWPDAGCPGCSMLVDQIGHLAHFHARRTSFYLVSRAPLKNLLRYKQRMEWDVPWVSSEGSAFNEDFGVTTPEGESFGLSIFLRDGARIYRTYFTSGRGVEALGSACSYLDLTPLGRQETWETSPPGWPQDDTYSWGRRHDDYRQRALGGKKK